MSRAALQEGKQPMTPWTLLAALPHMVRYHVVGAGSAGGCCAWALPVCRHRLLVGWAGLILVGLHHLESIECLQLSKVGSLVHTQADTVCSTTPPPCPLQIPAPIRFLVFLVVRIAQLAAQRLRKLAVLAGGTGLRGGFMCMHSPCT